MLVKRYAPSTEKMDSAAYFGLSEADQAALIADQILAEEKVKIMDGRYYVEDSVVGKYINGRFYWDDKQKVMLYTLPTEQFVIAPDTQEYQTSQGVQNPGYVILKSREILIMWISNLSGLIQIWSTASMTRRRGW